MKLLITIDKLNNKKWNDLIPLECLKCGDTFYRLKTWVVTSLNNSTDKMKYCGKNCFNQNRTTQIQFNCDNCGKATSRKRSHFSAQSHHFCSKKCYGIYASSHRKESPRRSKLELWLETELKLNYSNLNIKFNDYEAANCELDIYIPSLKLAFELNGKVHYEPIFGQETLNRIKNNDSRKFQACLERGMELCIIDSRSMKYFKEQNAKEFLSIIIAIIDQKIINLT